MDISIRMKFCLAWTSAIVWTFLSGWLALPWITDLSIILGKTLAILIVALIAFIPGFINTFLLINYLLDKRPRIKPLTHSPCISILIAAYNEEMVIDKTILSILSQNYPGKIEIIVIDDGSEDNTVNKIAAYQENVTLLRASHGGKARALNMGLAHASHDLIMTLDADTYLLTDAVYYLVERFLTNSTNVGAVAGAIYLANPNENFLTRLQQWDYLHHIAATKRAQSLYQSTLVAQGAFSLFRKTCLQEAGGWTCTIGEDIVLTWAILKKEYRIGYAEKAIALTQAPSTYKSLFYQRSRWERGLLEAIKIHPRIFFKGNITSFFAYLSLLFPFVNMGYFLVFFPGLIAACFGYYMIAGITTLFVLPITLIQNWFYHRTQTLLRREFRLPTTHPLTFILYVALYHCLIMPACLHGYFSELLTLEKKWGTKKSHTKDFIYEK